MSMYNYDFSISYYCSLYCVVFVEFDRDQYSVSEDAGSVQITLVLNRQPGATVNAVVTTVDRTATSKYLMQSSLL